MIKNSVDFFSLRYIENFIQRILEAYTINSISTYNAMFETKHLLHICKEKENIMRSINIINEIFLTTITEEEFNNIKVLIIVIQIKKSERNQNYYLIFPKQQQKVLKRMMNSFQTFINFVQELPNDGFLNQKYKEIKMYFYNVIDLIVFDQTSENIYNLEKKNSISHILNVNLLHYSMIQVDKKYCIYNQYLNKLYHKNPKKISNSGPKIKSDAKEMEKRYDLLKKIDIFRLHTAKLQQLLTLFRDKYYNDKKHHLLDNVALVFIGSGNNYIEDNLVDKLGALLGKNCE
ncbi:hypothetical protein COBT_003258 [Conglomerata obtusa]